MKIEFTKEQYENLIKLVHVGNFVINGIRVGEDEITQYNDLESYIYKHAKDFDLANLVAEEDGEFYPSQELEADEDLEQYMEEYTEEIFWDELGDRLAVQAILEHYDDESLNKMDAEQQFFLRMHVADQFQEEFEENGLEKVRVSDIDLDLEIPEIPKY